MSMHWLPGLKRNQSGPALNCVASKIGGAEKTLLVRTEARSPGLSRPTALSTLAGLSSLMRSVSPPCARVAECPPACREVIAMFFWPVVPFTQALNPPRAKITSFRSRDNANSGESIEPQPIAIRDDHVAHGRRQQLAVIHELTANSSGGPGNNLPEIWKLTSGSPTATATALSMPSGMTSSYAYGIAISGSDVYVAGTASNGTNDTAVYWLNGAATILPRSMTISEAGAIAVSGGNVYVTGFEENSAGNPTAVLWVNGVATTLAPPSGKAYSSAGTIVVSGSDVYVTGIASNTDSDEVAVLWVNGTATLLPMPNGLTGDYWAGGIAVSSGNVYISGNTSPDVGNDTAISWVNGGVATTLPIPPNDTTEGYGANAIAVSGGDVYVAGAGVSGTTGNTTAAYWLNGTATSLPLPTNTTVSPATSSAVGIGFSGSDVYMVGSAGAAAAYWVNGGAGTLLPLPSGTYESGASAIAVATQ